VGFYRITIDSPADESNSLAKESVVFRQFSTRFIFQSILEYLDNTWYRGTINTSCIIVFGKGNDLGKEDLEFAGSNSQAYTFQLDSWCHRYRRFWCVSNQARYRHPESDEVGVKYWW
jgi:hypothetical protein